MHEDIPKTYHEYNMFCALYKCNPRRAYDVLYIWHKMYGEPSASNEQDYYRITEEQQYYRMALDYVMHK